MPVAAVAANGAANIRAIAVMNASRVFLMVCSNHGPTWTPVGCCGGGARGGETGGGPEWVAAGHNVPLCVRHAARVVDVP
ncbi:hypothetical protein GCM10027038_01470 [Arthrobacter bambusae]